MLLKNYKFRYIPLWKLNKNKKDVMPRVYTLEIASAFNSNLQTHIFYIYFQTCEAIIQNLAPTELRAPNTREAWLDLAEKFHSRWNFPNGLFAIDGKRVLIQQPANSGSHFYDYKGNNSIIAMVAVGPEYEILAADVGMNGRMSDGGNWSRNQFRSLLEDPNNPLNIP